MTTDREWLRQQVESLPQDEEAVRLHREDGRLERARAVLEQMRIVVARAQQMGMPVPQRYVDALDKAPPTAEQVEQMVADGVARIQEAEDAARAKRVPVRESTTA